MIKINGKTVKIDTPNTTYIFNINSTGQAETLYYGSIIPDIEDLCPLTEKLGTGYGSSVNYTEGSPLSLNNICCECSTIGKGDFREPFAVIADYRGNVVGDFVYQSMRLIDNFAIPDLPNSYGKSETLETLYTDKAKGLSLSLYYSTFTDCDVIIKSASITNLGDNAVTIERLMSSQLDLPYKDYIMDTLDGTWAKERYINSRRITDGVFFVDSKVGASSSNHNPYVVIKKTDCSLNYGDAYGLNLVYSGNHMELAEVSFTGKTRILNGINPHGFKWTLDVGETFYTPEATLCFSALGTNGLTQNYHYFVNNHIVRGEWQNKPRPILANNWEATSFNFTEKKILDIAKASKALGIELFVLDDGWFGKRTDDTKGLGDWEVNKSRLPHGIDGLANKINSMGMSFGLWVEPEMVNSNSDLYRAHPDWAVVHPDYKPCLGRNQLLLDLTNTDVQNYIIDSMTKVFSYGNISYIKWDYNRNMSDYYSATLGNRQGEFFHRYMLGFYRVVNTLVTRFPKILFESCASGGNRVDLGLLCYMPQFWASDNTDAHDRVLIQEGTLTCYPQSTIGSHVSASPNMQTLRNSFIENRFNTASIGLLGYELDLTELNKVDSNAVSEQIKFYKKYRDTLQYGTYYRIKSIFADNHGSYIIVNKDKSQAVAFLFNNVAETVPPADILRTVGLDNEAMYRFETREQVFNIKVFGNLINYVLPIKIKDEGFLQEVLNNNIAMKCEVQKYCLSGQLLNNAGVKLDMAYNSTGYSKDIRIMGDFGSRIYMIDRIDK